MVYFPFKELSYKIIGIFFQVKNSYGSVHKELIYQNAFEEELNYLNIPYRREVNISVSSVKTKKRLGFYRADFIVDEKIIVEIKALKFIPTKLEQQIFKYLQSTQYEVGYLVNFGSTNIYFKRYILSNNNK